MSLRFLLLLAGWIAFLAYSFPTVLTCREEFLVFPKLLAWCMFIFFCCFGLTRCLIGPYSPFWIGLTTFSAVAVVAISLATFMYQPTLGMVVSDSMNFDRNNQVESLREDQIKDLSDLVIATFMAIIGGIIGQWTARARNQKQNKVPEAE